MKKYRVSLACQKPVNFECEIEAETEQEAVYKGVKLFESPEWGDGYIDDETDSEITLDISDPDDPKSDTEIPSGAYVEELK